MRNKKFGLMLGLAAAMVMGAGATQDEGGMRDPLDQEPQSMRTLSLAGNIEKERVYTGTEFNPAISVILDFTYARMTGETEAPPGFEPAGHSHGHGHGHDHGHGIEEGLRLREVELTLTGTVDPYFDAMVTMGFTADHVEVEEAFINTRMLGKGLQVKAGKFLSDVGYINKQHMHDWQFVDQPWMREFIFGGEGLNEIGIQISWLPPTTNYIRLGAEILEGQSEGIANYHGNGRHEILTMLPDNERPDRQRWRADKELREKQGPRLFTGFAKFGPDIGHNHAIQVGVSGGYSRVMQAEEVHSSGRLETWDGDAWFAGLDSVYKYTGKGAMGHGNLVLQAEYMYREKSLQYRSREFTDFATLTTTDANDQRWRQDGLYVQGVYGFAPRWNAGLRADVMGLINEGFGGRGVPESFGTSTRYSGQISYAPTEFSRLRAQASLLHPAEENHNSHHHDEVWMFVLQYNISLGVHGAHAF